MVDQLVLPLQQKLKYSADNFVQHSGVRDLFEECLALPGDSFALRFIYGASRSGKTHFAIALCERLLSNGRSFPLLFSGAEFQKQLNSGELLELSEGAGSRRTTFIVDDGDLMLRSIQTGGSGPLVAFIELLRRQHARLILLSGAPVDQLPCDEHVLSRLKAGITTPLGPPAEEEIPGVLERLLHQRGVVLTPRSRDFFLKRGRREIPSLERYIDRAIHLSQVLGRSITFSTIPRALALDH